MKKLFRRIRRRRLRAQAIVNEPPDLRYLAARIEEALASAETVPADPADPHSRKVILVDAAVAARWVEWLRDFHE